MQTLNRNNVAIVYSLILTAAFVGCDQKASRPSNTDKSDNATSSTTLPNDLFTTEQMADARGVADVKQDEAATGDVVITGRIGGRKTPFVDGAAMFVLTDSSLKTCDELHGDKCPTPWDYCCETRDSLLANTATIQITGDDGKPLAIDIKDQHGLTPSATVMIAGTVSMREGDQLVIDAKRINVK